jgi:hypothetical protein
VNYYLHSFLALELAEGRWREADQYRLAAIAAGARPPNSARVRRPVARVLAAVSRLAAVVGRRLDKHAADEFGRALTLISDGEGSK